MIDIENSPFFRGFVLVVALAFAVVFLVVAVVLGRRRRIYSTGVRGSGVVIRVDSTPVMNRYSAVESPSEMVTVATHMAPNGVAPQKVPAGQYVVGQEVPVIQPAGRPHEVRLDRPDLEIPRWKVIGTAAMALVAPMIAVQYLLNG
ncbi:hypothetical protein ACNHYB_08090 [Isoptericola jiangsuensis]|uniref:hypothetical protein n=1 Tax=Isoptericola jiangsuensis TaxID=548579 RepID=UPI003AB0DD14